VLAVAVVTIGSAIASGPGEPTQSDVEIRRARAVPARPAEPPAEDTPTSKARVPNRVESPTSTAVAAVASIVALSEEYGEPAEATFGRLRVPVLGVDAPLSMQNVGSDGAMPNPLGPSDVVWYDFASWEGYGGAIGDGANAILSGHVDYAGFVAWAGVEFRGPGVFFSLDLLSPGDIVEVEVNGELLQYAVQWQRQVEATDSAAWTELLSANVEVDSLTIITCGGQFNSAARAYLDRVVVRAVRV